MYIESFHSFSKVSCPISFMQNKGVSWKLNLSDRYDKQSPALNNDWPWDIAVWTAILATPFYSVSSSFKWVPSQVKWEGRPFWSGQEA